MTTSNAPENYLDLWLQFDGDDDEARAEANTRLTDTGYAIDWYLNDVGLVATVEFDTLADAYDWYERENFQDFTMID
mgnify:FL=1